MNRALSMADLEKSAIVEFDQAVLELGIRRIKVFGELGKLRTAMLDSVCQDLVRKILPEILVLRLPDFNIHTQCFRGDIPLMLGPAPIEKAKHHPSTSLPISLSGCCGYARVFVHPAKSL
jgi:hypothetical protein